MPNKPAPVAYPTARAAQRHSLKNSPLRRERNFARARGFFGWLLVLSVFLFLATNFTLWSADNLLKIANQVSAVVLQKGDATRDTVTFPAGHSTSVTPYDNGLAVVDTDTLYILQSGNITRFTQQLPYSNPVAQANKRVVMVYDRDGSQFTISDGIATVADVELESPIVCASISEGGIAMVTDENGYKSAVTVFDERGNQVYKWSTSEYYVARAEVSPDGKILCAVGYRQQSTDMITQLFFFDLSQETMQNQVYLGDTVTYSLDFMADNTVVAVCDNATFVCDAQGKMTEVASYSSDELLYFDTADNRILLAMRAWEATARADVTLYDRTAREVGAFTLTTEPLSLRLSGDTVAVLTASGVTSYNSDGVALGENTAASGSLTLLTDPQNGLWALFGKSAMFLS